jgi:hypothetical protein
MVRMFIRHQVADYPAWRAVYDEFDAERTPMGSSAMRSFSPSTTRTT